MSSYSDLEEKKSLQLIIDQLTNAKEESNKKISELENKLNERSIVIKKQDEKIVELDNIIAQLTRAKKESNTKISELENKLNEQSIVIKERNEKIAECENTIEQLSQYV